MKVLQPIKIVSMGKYLPINKVRSEELELALNMPSGWSERYSGVRERHHSNEESGGVMGARAIETALEKASMQLSDIDLLICASATFDYPLPNQASVIKKELKDGHKVNIPSISVDSTCLSFVSALDVVSTMLDGKRYRNAIVVSSEIASKGINPENWETASLFGDGAVAAIVSYDESGQSGVIKGGMRTYSEGVFDTIIRGGGNENHAKDVAYDPDMHSFHMSGKKLLKLAKKKIPEFMKEFFSDLSMKIEDADLVIPHQASKSGVMIFEKMYKFKEGQVYGNLETHGNCIAASIPMSLHDAIEEGKIRRGDTCMLCGTSAGFSIGAVLIKY